MARITFSIDDELAKAAEVRAKQDRRSLSAHISMLVENDARAAGLAGEDVAQKILAAAEDVGYERAMAAIQALPRRKKRAA